MKKLSKGISAVKQAGFTLIELVIVIVIIGILAAVAVPNFSKVADDAIAGVEYGYAAAASSQLSADQAFCKGNLTSCSGGTGYADCAAAAAGASLKPPKGYTCTVSGTTANACTATCTKVGA